MLCLWRGARRRSERFGCFHKPVYIVLQRLGPGGVVQRLGHHVPRGFGALQFDQDQRAVRGQRKKVDTTAVAGAFLAADNHPLRRQNLGCRGDHVL